MGYNFPYFIFHLSESSLPNIDTDAYSTVLSFLLHFQRTTENFFLVDVREEHSRVEWLDDRMEKNGERRIKWEAD